MTRAEEMNLSQIGEWYFSLSDKWPDVFPDAELADYWRRSRVIGGCRPEDHPLRFVPYLRAGALRLLRASVTKCTSCPLYKNRLTGRPVLEDGSYWNDPFENRVPVGATSAEIMIISEGPGAFEARTGNPFVSYQVLAGSSCAFKCAEYEKCYNPSSRFPQQACNPVSIENGHSPEEIQQIRQARAAANKFPIATVASVLDNALTKAGLWREGWNTRQELRSDVTEATKAKPGTVYLTNMVKCRSCRISGGKTEDVAPSVEEMDTCTPWLQMQIHIIQPIVLIALGNPAVSGTTGINQPKILSMRGSLYPSKWDLPVLAEVHPSWIARQPADEQAKLIAGLADTFSKAQDVTTGKLVVPWLSNQSDVLDDQEIVSLDNMQFIDTFNSE